VRNSIRCQCKDNRRFLTELRRFLKIIRNLINQLAKMAMSGHQPSLGFTVQPHQIKAFKDAITYVQERTNGKAKRTIDKIANDFEKASKFGKKPTVIFALTPDAIPHEMVHDARIQAMVANTIEDSHSQEYIDKVVSSSLFAKSSIGKLYAGKLLCCDIPIGQVRQMRGYLFRR